MVQVLYGQHTNAVLGGVMFYDGIAEFENDEEGIDFANMFYRQYEVVEDKPKKAPAKKKVKKVE